VNRDMERQRKQYNKNVEIVICKIMTQSQSLNQEQIWTMESEDMWQAIEISLTWGQWSIVLKFTKWEIAKALFA
jgi:hypothetical protein